MSTTEDKLIADYTLLLSQTKAVSDIDVKNWSHKNVFTEHHFYVHLIQYFAPLFPDADEKIRDQLTLICFCYLRGLLGFDRVLDENDHSRFKLGLIHYEAAVKNTCSLFNKEHAFWREHSDIQASFFAAMETDGFTCRQAISR